MLRVMATSSGFAPSITHSVACWAQRRPETSMVEVFNDTSDPRLIHPGEA